MRWTGLQQFGHVRDATTQQGCSAVDDTMIRTAAQSCADGTSPLPETGYKVDLIVATLIETLERLRDSQP